MTHTTAHYPRLFRRAVRLKARLLRFIRPDLLASLERQAKQTPTSTWLGQRVFTCSLAACLLMATLGITSQSQAESYIAGMVGGTFESKSSDIEFKDPRLAPGFSSTDLDHDLAVAYGGKIGYYFDSLPWLGGEIEGYSSTPDMKQQQAIITAPNGASLPTTFTKTDLRVTVIGINALIRYPHPTIQPYLGAGLGIFIPDFPSQQTNAEPGLNGLAGIRLKITEHVGVFVEYKYNRATFTIDPASRALGFEMTYQAHHGMFGVSYHF